ncbi:Hypothetical protein POVR1_LOCUS598 [uncultured virus]|nr:Hypothetical protein POVR1_LOCUS598 [uncultured virus]
MIEIIHGTDMIDPVAYRALVEALPALVQPKTDAFANIIAETIEGTAVRVILLTYLPIFIIITIIVIILSVSELISPGVAIFLIITAIIIFVVFFFIAMSAYRRTLPGLTKQFQTTVFNSVGIFGGVVFRELLFLATCF